MVTALNIELQTSVEGTPLPVISWRSWDVKTLPKLIVNGVEITLTPEETAKLVEAYDEFLKSVLTAPSDANLLFSSARRNTR